MHHPVSRRQFLYAGALALGGLALPAGRTFAIEPFARPGQPRLLLSVAAYSFRQYFKDTSHSREQETDPKNRIDLFDFVDRCADWGVAGAELTSYYFPAKPSREFLTKLRRHCFVRGVAISGTAVGNTFTHPPGPKRDEQIQSVKTWIDHAAILGAPHIRVFAGEQPRGTSAEDARKHCLSALEECADYAGRNGIFLGIENHGGIVAEADALLEIVRAVKSPWVGINLDSGNFHTEDPYRDLERCAPYAVNVQLKAEIHRRGAKQEPADLARMVQILRAAHYQGYVALEYESAQDPWIAVPPLLERLKKLLA